VTRRKRYKDASYYEKKLHKVMARFSVEEGQYHWNWDRFEATIQFEYKSEWYQFTHDTRREGVDLAYGSDAFAQLVITLEDLARMVERGIYDLSTWVEGMRYLPAPEPVPSFLKFMGFDEIPDSMAAVDRRRKELLMQFHPDHGGSGEDFKALQTAYSQARQYMATREKGAIP